MTVTAAEVRGWRATVAARIATAEQRGKDDPVFDTLDIHRACVAELDAWIDELDRQGNDGS